MSDDIPALWRVDCIPQPRYRESLEAFTERMRGYVRDEAAQRRALAVRNRQAALTTVTTGDGVLFTTRCACRWHGLAVTDPEVARREYDAHDCELDRVEIGVSCHRKGEPLGADWAAEDKRQLEREPVSAPSQRVVADDSAQRMALLELK